MANLQEENKWEEGIRQIEIHDPIKAGADGIANMQAKQLANRTKFLREETERLEKEKVAVNLIGFPNGVASLGENGRVPASQLPETALEYKGNWDASTNIPHLEDGVGTLGDLYKVSAGGTVTFGSGNTVTFYTGDRVAYNGTKWERWDGSKEIDGKLAKIYPYIYTGRSLKDVFGVSTVAEVFAKLKEKSDTGNFEGLGLGDYVDLPSITIDGSVINWSDAYENLRCEIVAFDQYYRNGNTIQHHIVMQTKNIPFKHRMNENTLQAGGYIPTDLRAYLANTVVPAVENAIGISLKSIWRILSTTAYPDWYDEKVFIPTEVECIGTKALADNYHNPVGNSRQWSIFQIRPDKLIKFYNGVRNDWWTSSVSDFDSSPSKFVSVTSKGDMFSDIANSQNGVSFAFAI